MNAPDPSVALAHYRAAIRAAHGRSEGECLALLRDEARLPEAGAARVQERAATWVAALRADGAADFCEAFLREYDLSSREGGLVMALAEALLRIPGRSSAERLILDKLAQGDWRRHLGHSSSWLVNAATWMLLLSSKLLDIRKDSGLWHTVEAKASLPAIRLVLEKAMALLASRFVIGETIAAAIARAAQPEWRDARFSYDMLGEAALSTADAERYYAAYAHAIAALVPLGGAAQPPGISVKLSALHPRFEEAQRSRVLAELVPRLAALAEQAGRGGLTVTVDAEECARLELTLDVFETVLRHHPGTLGLAVQAYQKRAPALLDWLAELAGQTGKRIPVRLVKGAYWDGEIKRAQVLGLADYPVYTRKANSDVAFLACARRLLGHDGLLPGFATHNAHSVAYLLEVAGGRQDIEFQRLFGMGEALYRQAAEVSAIPCRVYAPVGDHRTLLPYLVRRLLEGGANSSFICRVGDAGLSPAEVVADPLATTAGTEQAAHPRLPSPRLLFGERINSLGLDLADGEVLARLAAAVQAAPPLRAGRQLPLGELREVRNPARPEEIVGWVEEATAAALESALAMAHGAAAEWGATPAQHRALILERGADQLEQRIGEFIALLVREAGKTLPDALAEVREAVDYCRYYAALARRDFAAPQALPGPVGESNEIAWHGRGVFACISPWNFPLAIFLGQVVAALAAGNAVIAKPARQTPLVAWLAVKLLWEAGVPAEVLHFLAGPGGELGERLVADPRVAGVAFTGSTATAQHINRLLANRPGPLAVLVAETGGINAMIADSSALPEQVAQDALTSAFNSAGQRCSALRLLFVEEDAAPALLERLAGGLAETAVGDPAQPSSDIGPLIDADARLAMAEHAARMVREGRLVARAKLSAELPAGWFFAPCIVEIDRAELLDREVFGPILHVVRYSSDHLDAVIDAINASGYGLTLGIHSRIEETVRRIRARARVGNLYVNRNMIGAVVGVQPFGGEGLSGTGPKAGGPDYLKRFAVERTFTVNTAALGGNPELLGEL